MFCTVDGHIDWLSFTLKSPVAIVSLPDLYDVAKGLLKEISNEHKNYVFDGQGFDVCGGRPPFSFALERDDRGIRIFGGGSIDSVLFELTGRACEGLREHESAIGFVAPLLEAITRLDYAVDVRTATRPAEFSNERARQNFRSISFIRSDTGETVYVGSPKSDRFARVYRYNDPHPRAELLRIEHVFRRGLAKDACQVLCQSGSAGRFCALIGNTWGWCHADWQPTVRTDERLRVAIVTREHEDTIRWLYKQCAPAIRRLVESGALDWQEFEQFIFKPPPK